MSGRLANPSQAVIRMQRILCGVDFSDFSRHALAHAAAIARDLGAHQFAGSFLWTLMCLASIEM